MCIQLKTETNGTYSLKGLNDKHLNILKQLLNTCSLGAEMLQAMSIEEAQHYFQNFNGGQNLTESEVQTLINQELESSQCVTEILKAITTK